MRDSDIYGRGVLDGMETVLLLILGSDEPGSMRPYPGHLNRSAREYAELRLAAVRETKRLNFDPLRDEPSWKGGYSGYADDESGNCPSRGVGVDLSLASTSAGDAAKAMTELAKGGLPSFDALNAARSAWKARALAAERDLRELRKEVEE